MKFILVTGCLLNLISFSLSGQTEKKSGYIINQSGDTIKGLLVFKDKLKSDEFIQFQNDDSTLKKLNAYQLNGYGIDGISDVISKNVSVDISPDNPMEITEDKENITEKKQVFLTRIAGNSLKLYTYDDNKGKKHFYYSKNDSVPVELILRKYLLKEHNQSYIRKIEKYKNQLMYIMSDSKSASDRIKKTEFNESSLSELFERYASEKQEVSISKNESSNKSILGIYAGFENTILDFSPSDPAFIVADAEFPASTSLTGGIRYFIPIKKFSKRHWMILDLAYSGFNGTSDYIKETEIFGSTQTKIYNFKINYNSLKLETGYNYKLKTSERISLDLNAGFGLSFILSHDYSFTMNETYQNTKYPEVKGDLFPDATKNFQQFIFGGLQINFEPHIFLAAFYQRGNGMINFTHFTATTETAKVVLGFKF